MSTTQMLEHAHKIAANDARGRQRSDEPPARAEQRRRRRSPFFADDGDGVRRQLLRSPKLCATIVLLFIILHAAAHCSHAAPTHESEAAEAADVGESASAVVGAMSERRNEEKGVVAAAAGRSSALIHHIGGGGGGEPVYAAVLSMNDDDDDDDENDTQQQQQQQSTMTSAQREPDHERNANNAAAESDVFDDDDKKLSSSSKTSVRRSVSSLQQQNDKDKQQQREKEVVGGKGAESAAIIRTNKTHRRKNDDDDTTEFDDNDDTGGGGGALTKSMDCRAKWIPQTDTPNPDSFVCVCSADYCDEPEPFHADVDLANPNTLVFYSTNRAADRLTKRTTLFQAPTSDASERPLSIISVDATKTYQTIFGFGGAFTDAAGINIRSLSEGAQNNLMKSYFDKDKGIGYNLCRTPIASCDFSTHEYSYCDKEGDFGLSTFALTQEDHDFKIPYIRQAYNLSGGELRLFASPWSAPAWMKSTGKMQGGGPMKAGDEYLDTWANYFRRYFEEYHRHGIDFWGLTMQNEPRVDVNFPWQSMNLNTAQQRDFAYTHLRPALQKSDITKHIKIMAFDDNRGEAARAADTFYTEHPERASGIDGMALHWYDFGDFANLTHAHNVAPHKFLLASESCIDTYPKKPLFGDWARAMRYGVDMLGNMQHWAIGWIDWNICVDMQGGPNWVKNWVDAPIIVNHEKDEFYKQPIFYFMAHYSKFVPRGSVRISSEQLLLEENETKPSVVDEEATAANAARELLLHVAFATPAGERVLVLINTSPRKTQHVRVRKDDANAQRVAHIDVGPETIVTAIWRPAAAASPQH